MVQISEQISNCGRLLIADKYFRPEIEMDSADWLQPAKIKVTNNCVAIIHML